MAVSREDDDHSGNLLSADQAAWEVFDMDGVTRSYNNNNTLTK